MQDQREKQIKALEKHGTQLMKSSSEKKFNNLIYYFKDKSVAKYFIGFKGPLISCSNTKNGYINIEKAE